MATAKIDTTAPVHGDGSERWPFNTHVGVTIAPGDRVAYRRGSFTRFTAAAPFPAQWLGVDFVELGAYGPDYLPRPAFTGGVVRADWTVHLGSVYKRSMQSNVGGNITEDGVPMAFVAWVSTATADGLLAGQFTFDFNTFTLYMRPSSGVPADHVYEASELDYLISSAASRVGFLMEDWDLRQASTHLLRFLNRVSGVVRRCRFWLAGGRRDTAQSVWLGNTMELADGCHDWRVYDNEFWHAYDSGLTPQVYGARGRISTHRYWNNRFYDCGLAGLEIAVITPRGLISDVRYQGMHFERMNRGGNWSKLAPGSGRGVACSTYVHPSAGETSRIHACHGRAITFKDIQRGWVSGGTSGINSMEDMTGDVPEVYLCSSNLVVNHGVGQVDLFRNVRDGAGNTPVNSGNSKYRELLAPMSFADAAI